MGKSFEAKQKDLYNTFKPIFCPVLNEMVYFNAQGFHHLVYQEKKQRPRSAAEKRYRLKLIPYIHEVLSNSTKVLEEIKSHDPFVTTLSLSHPVSKAFGNGKKCEVKVILIRKGLKGKLHFLSVMCEGKCKTKRT